MSQQHWQPTATSSMLRARAQLNQQIRSFFQARQVLEVETPLLSRTIGTDPNLHPVAAHYQAHPQAVAEAMYLQTSPEFAMKRLLASGSGPIFQLCKAFRNGESGSRHNPEFSMLEWYRPGFTLDQLIDEVEALAAAVLGAAFGNCERLSYRQLFEQRLGVDPHTADTETLATLAGRHIELTFNVASRDTWLELLYSQLLEPDLQQAVFIHDYPASQAALSRLSVDPEGQVVARRFELVVRGMEIANGYDELVDADEQQSRFAADQELRRRNDLPVYPADERLLAALRQGLPACAGVALGVDRLLMLQSGARSIEDVLAFPHARA